MAMIAGVGAADVTIQGGQVNGSGATLFVDFFKVPASTNDDYGCDGHDGVDGDMDCNGNPYWGFDLGRSNCGQSPVDQLAPFFDPGQDWTGWWLFQYRSVGSVEGFGEFVSNQLCDVIPQSVPSEAGLINRFEFARLGQTTWGGPFADCDGDGDTNDESGTPYCPGSIDFAFTDVLASWAVRAGNENAGQWSRTPTANGYGWNSIPSNNGFVSRLESLGRDCDGDGTEESFLNTSTGDADSNTIYGFSVAWVPIVPVTNRGTGVENLKNTEFQHLMVAGRLPSGENLVGATRDVGSGTRNGEMNTAGIDPAWGRGDNLGARNADGNLANLGPKHQPTNCGGSGIIEDVVKNRRLALGYTGLAGGSRAAKDALDGKYEIANLMNDHVGGTQYVRPEVRSDSDPNFSPILDNGDPNTGWRLGGSGTFTTRGDFHATDDQLPEYMENQAAADYFRNLECSIAQFTSDFDRDEVNNMPGQFLGLTFFLLAGMDYLPEEGNPTSFLPNINLNQELQDYIRANNNLDIGVDTPLFGSRNTAGFVPKRVANPDFNGDGTPDGYSDGSMNGNYYNPQTGVYEVSSSFRLNERNQISGDFNNDKARNVSDIAGLVQAIHNPRAYQAGVDFGGNRENMPFSGDYVIVEIIGDFDGDGNFDGRDVRYFADGLALQGGSLNRKEGFTRVDNEWSTLTGDNNYFDTSLATGVDYVTGASRADIAGGGDPIPGAYPNGSDGAVNCVDIDYVYANFGNWANLDEAVLMDLSADMNGDLIVDQLDMDAVVQGILCTEYGDADLDGDVDADDLATVNANLGQSGLGWCGGDFDGDGAVDADDVATVNATQGFVSSCLSGCNGNESLSVKCKDGTFKVVGKLKNGTEGVTYVFTLDGAATKEDVASRRGVAKGVFKNVSAGAHTVTVCGLSDNTTCN
ncbi:MAG: hypothetical protein IT449_03990 [Phycisphaerales bacterium]|nr:hypothetical protein [Phycisphaerales bacterium]